MVNIVVMLSFFCLGMGIGILTNALWTKKQVYEVIETTKKIIDAYDKKYLLNKENEQLKESIFFAKGSSVYENISERKNGRF